MPLLAHTPRVRENELEDLSQWVYFLAPWSVYFTGTFRGEYSEQSTQRAFERFMRKGYSSLSYFYSIESNPSREGHHVHALFADCEGLYRRDMWSKWFKRFGRVEIEPVRSQADVAAYCSKHLVGYLTKDGGWWNFLLSSPDLWHRQKKGAS